MNRQTYQARPVDALANIIDIEMIVREPQFVEVTMNRERQDIVPLIPDDNISLTVPASLIQSLCVTFKDMQIGDDLLFPINKICNLNVNVFITKHVRNHYTFTIHLTHFNVENDRIYDKNYSNVENVFDEENFIQYIAKNILSELKKIKIDKLNGKFTTTQLLPKYKKMQEMWSEFCQEFKNDEHISLSINECCVCFTMTNTVTNCRHSVCLECISKLEDTVTHEVSHKNCPLCRQRIQRLFSS
jgi:hypothetical protein